MNSWNPNSNLQTNYNPYNNWSQPRYTATPIHGVNAAWQFPMGNNSEIYLPDADQDLIWWIRTDNTGNRTVTPFDVTLHKDPDPVDYNNIIERLNNIEERLNAKSNKPNAKRASENLATSIE